MLLSQRHFLVLYHLSHLNTSLKRKGSSVQVVYFASQVTWFNAPYEFYIAAIVDRTLLMHTQSELLSMGLVLVPIDSCSL